MSYADDGRDELIREQAYHLWATDGSPPGADLRYWQEAKLIVAGRMSAATPVHAKALTYYEGGISAQP